MIIILTESSKQIINYESHDFVKDFNFLKKRLLSVYKFIRKNHFSHSLMILEKQKTLCHKEYKKLPYEFKNYINRFYDIAIKRFYLKEIKQLTLKSN